MSEWDLARALARLAASLDAALPHVREHPLVLEARWIDYGRRLELVIRAVPEGGARGATWIDDGEGHRLDLLELGTRHREVAGMSTHAILAWRDAEDRIVGWTVVWWDER